MLSSKSPQTPFRTPLAVNARKTPTTSSSYASDGTPFTPFSSRALSSAFTTPLHTDEKPPAKKSVADISSNWRMKSVDSSSDSHAEKPALLRSPAFLSNDRRLARAEPSPSRFEHVRSPRSSQFSSLSKSSSSPSQPKLQLAAPFSFKPSSRSSHLQPYLDQTSNDGLSVILDEDLDSACSFTDRRTRRDDSEFFIRMDQAPESPARSATVCHSPPSSSTASCSGCGSRLPSISYLKPCLHPICQQCFTGIMNIVGEKGLQCPACQSAVLDFSRPSRDPSHQLQDIASTGPYRRRFRDTIDSTASIVLAPATSAGPQVIRVDNLPWDVTPTMLANFLAVPTDRIHILLERATGKTLSHCFVELSPSNARTALRACQNKIIGEGRRTRAVSVTVSSQEELMKELFPTWRGTFVASRPCLHGLRDQREITDAIRHGLLSLKELDGLLALVHNPESPFLKDSTLPFYSLISIMEKFPTDNASRVFWNAALRDHMFAIVQAASHILAIRVSQQDWSRDLLDQFARTGAECLAFTDVQRRLIVVSTKLPSEQTSSSVSSTPSEVPATPAEAYFNDLEPQPQYHRVKPAASSNIRIVDPSTSRMSPRSFFEEVGSDVGVDADVVKMVYQRLFALQ